MKPSNCSAMILLIASFVSFALSADEPIKSQADIKKTAEESLIGKDVKRVTLEEARVKAKLLHEVYSSTLDVMHHHYFREDRSAIPARVMVDIFAELEEKEGIKARWISVNAKAMSIDHKPADDFEKLAAKSMATGKGAHEVVEKDVYRRAGSISLMNRGCLGCHLGFGASGKKDRFAGLVISIPILND